MDGVQCPMTPTCSVYGEHAISEHSILGLLLTTDRLVFREVGDLGENYIRVFTKTSARYYDPLEDSLPVYFGGQDRPSLFQEDFSK